jgi:ABC-2 type transport system permease protein
MTGPTTDRGTWRLVARRDFWVRLRERSFLISTLLNIAVISILVLARAYGGGGAGPSFDLGYVGTPAVAQGAAELGAKAGVTVRVHQLADEQAADAALRDGSMDAVVVGDLLVAKSSIDDTLGGLVQASERNVRLAALLDQHGVTAEERAAANAPLGVQTLEAPPPAHRPENAQVAFVAVILLYGQLFGYGIWVASGVIEEKASRVVELLLSAIRPKQLLAGKIVGIGILGLGQLIVVATFAIVLALVTGAIKVPLSAIGAAGLVVGWFILGFAFYASLFAAAGALASRMEELQNVIVPINLIILVSFFISIGALQNPNGTLVTVASLVPTSAPLAMPVRIVLGAAPAWQIALSLALIIGSTILLVPAAARLYMGAILRSGGRVKIRDAWRAAA